MRYNGLSAFLLGAVFAAASTASSLYSITDVGPVSDVKAINNRGDVLGTDAGGQPFLYRHGHVRLLPQPSGAKFVAGALNNLGQVAGYVNYTGQFNFYLAIYSHGDLKVLTDVPGVDPVAFNDRGQIAGDLVFSYRTFLYSDGNLTVITPSGTPAAARGMNWRGQVVGVTLGATRLGYLASLHRFSTILAPDGNASEADGINRWGEIAGIWNPNKGSSLNRVFIQREGDFRDLGTAFNAAIEEDSVRGINRFGVIAGTARTDTLPFTAIAYYRETGFADLNNLIPCDSGWYLQFANGINDRGQIAGVGTVNGAQHGFVLTPLDDDHDWVGEEADSSGASDE